MPHVCGDEPFENKTVLEEEVVCPTYVGMNRTCGRADYIHVWYAPRMWG